MGEKKSRDITLPTKVYLVKAMVFPVFTYGCERWTITKAESQRIDAFELWCWRGLLRIPWTSRRSTNQSLRKSVLNIHWKDWCWSWSSSTLATWSGELTQRKRPWCWERLKAGGERDNRGWMVGWHHRLNGHEFEQALGGGKGQGSLLCCSPWGHKESDKTKWLSNNQRAQNSQMMHSRGGERGAVFM